MVHKMTHFKQWAKGEEDLTIILCCFSAEFHTHTSSFSAAFLVIFFLWTKKIIPAINPISKLSHASNGPFTLSSLSIAWPKPCMAYRSSNHFLTFQTQEVVKAEENDWHDVIKVDIWRMECFLIKLFALALLWKPYESSHEEICYRVQFWC